MDDAPSPASPMIFGEMLFDCFPDGSSVLGGAPFNVAWHLQGMGFSPLMISAVGDDELGKRGLNAMREWGMDTSAVQVSHAYPTGQVTVSFNQGEPVYEILPDQAYDHVSPEPLAKTLRNRQYALLYHGTLAMRTERARERVNALIKDYRLPVFVDVNLRVPWWSEQQVLETVSRAKWVKVNRDELSAISGTNIHSEAQLLESAKVLYNSHGMELLIVTLGEDGALCLHKGGVIRGRPAPVKNLVDTVGAGDAFSAAMVAGILKKWQLQAILDKALAFASAVCRMRGATSADRQLYQAFGSAESGG